jgi:hypothetical protein
VDLIFYARQCNNAPVLPKHAFDPQQRSRGLLSMCWGRVAAARATRGERRQR